MTLPKGYKFEEVSVAKKEQARESQVKACKANQDLAAERRKKYNESPKLCLNCQSPRFGSVRQRFDSFFADHIEVRRCTAGQET